MKLKYEKKEKNSKRKIAKLVKKNNKKYIKNSPYLIRHNISKQIIIFIHKVNT